MSALKTDLAIAGAGIAGATLALAAGRRGWRVAVVDPDPAPRHHPYPEILWRPSLAAFDRLGVGDDVRRRAGVPLRGVELRDPRGRRILRVGSEALRDEEVGAWSTDPTATRRILLDAALATGMVQHLGGRAVMHVQRNADGTARGLEAQGPDGRLVVEAPLIAGADGAESRVREACGIGMESRDFPLAFVVAEGPVPRDVPHGFASAHLDPHGFHGGLLATARAPLPGGRAGLVALVDASGVAEPPGEAFRQVLVELDPALAEWPGLTEARVLRRRVGHANAYARRGVVLLGDAAHPVSPLGGQGADMAIADALAFDAHLLGRPGARPTDEAVRAYELERRQPNERGLRSSRRGDVLLRLARLMPFSGAVALATMRVLDRLPGVDVFLARRKAATAQSNGRN